MKRSFKYPLLVALTFLIITSLVISIVNAQPVPIGETEQARPYESRPTVAAPYNIPQTFGNERDGSLATMVSMLPPDESASARVELSGFTIPSPAEQFTIGWVDIKMKYSHSGVGDDQYKIEYKTSGTAGAYAQGPLQQKVSYPWTKFDNVSGAAQVRPWTNLAPTSGSWNWTQVQNLMIRIFMYDGVDPTWAASFDLYEVWITIYELGWTPPSSSTAMSVMPGFSNISIVGLLPGKYFFVDVYVNGLSPPPNLWGYQASIKYDESIVTATSWFSYDPFVTAVSTSISSGLVVLAYGTFTGDIHGFNGTATPLCRIYFQVDSGGGTPLDLIDDRDAEPPVFSELKPVLQPGYVPSLYDGWFSGPMYLSAQPPTVIDLTSPLTTIWKELYPNYGDLWHLLSWETDPADTLLVGSAPSVGVSLTSPGAFPKFHDANTNGVWDVGEPAIWDDDEDDFYDPDAGDYLLVGTEPEWYVDLTAPGSLDKFHDANTNGVWSVGEPAIRDVDNSGTYNPEVKLGPCDQIDMTNATGWTYWFHVEEVTITIHWTVKDEFNFTTTEKAAAEPLEELTTPLGDPTGTFWHMIYPNYSDTIEITSWEDTDESGTFNASDQFDYTLGAGDVLLVGSAPSVGVALTVPNEFPKFYDENTNGVWDVGEPAIWDDDEDDVYDPDAGDYLLTGTEPEWYVDLTAPGSLDKFHDANTNGVWDVGEPAIRDVDNSGTYNVAETFWAHLDAVSTDIIVNMKPIPPEYTGAVPEFPLGITLLLLIAPIIPLIYLWRLRKKVPKQ